jgi:DNA ligase-associated metallophosphoesterase
MPPDPAPAPGLAPRPAPSAATPSPGAVFTLAGERVELSARRALYWPRERTLFVADVHLGKGASFRAGGVPVPRGSTAADLARLAALVADHGATRLVVLGDFIHAAAGRVPALDAAFRAWRESQPALHLLLVRGNHDERAGDPPPAWGVEVVSAPHLAAPFLLCHEPSEPPTGFALCGHVHPGVRVAADGDSARLPCFVLGRRRALLPAFGRMTGLALISPAPDETIVAVAGSRLFTLPAG